MDLGTILAQLRKQKGLSQRQFANTLGVSNGAIGMWETNKRQPDIEMLKKIATFFSVSVDYLLDMPKPKGNSPMNSISNIMTNKEQDLIKTFRQLDTDNKDIAIGEIKKLLKEQRLSELSPNKSSLKKIT